MNGKSYGWDEHELHTISHATTDTIDFDNNTVLNGEVTLADFDSNYSASIIVTFFDELGDVDRQEFLDVKQDNGETKWRLEEAQKMVDKAISLILRAGFKVEISALGGRVVV